MAMLRINAAILACDGCDQQLNNGEMFPTAPDARIAGFIAGWRYPGRRTKAGTISTSLVSDVCPSCLPSWRPQEITARHMYRRLDGSTR